jgi:hypothetical protein
MGGTTAFRFSLADSLRRDVASGIFQACDVTEVNGPDFRMASIFRGFWYLFGVQSPLHDIKMKRFMNAAALFWMLPENVRKCFSPIDRS